MVGLWNTENCVLILYFGSFLEEVCATPLKDVGSGVTERPGLFGFVCEEQKLIQDLRKSWRVDVYLLNRVFLLSFLPPNVMHIFRKYI